MPICITCSHPVKNLYTTYSKADDRSLGKGVRLTQCPNCKRFADKYVEHDYVVLFIDLVLIKPQVYRHLLFNRLQPTVPTKTSPQSLDPSILRLGILLILFDVYITWARIERVNTPSPSATTTSTSTSISLSNSPTSPASNFSNAPIITQYLFFLTLNVIATLVQHGVIRGLAKILLKPRNGHGQAAEGTEFVDVDSNGTGISTSDSKSQHLRSSSSPSKFNQTSSVPQSSKATPNPSQVSIASASASTPAPSSNQAMPTATTTPDDTTSRPPLGLSMTNGTGSNGNAHASQTPSQPSLSPSTLPPTQTQPHAHPQPQTNPPTTTPDTTPQPDLSTTPTASASASANANAISTALLVSSCTKLFPILLVIWPTSTSTSTSTSTVSPSSTTGSPPSPAALPPFAYRATSYIGWIVLVNNIEALLILLDCGYVVATSLAVAGLVSRWVVEGWLLGVVGLVRDLDAEGPVGDVLGLVGWVARLGRWT